MEAEWCLISEGELNPVSSNNEYTAEMQGQEKKWRVEVQKDKHQQKWEEAEKRAWEEAEHLVHEEAERKVEEEHKVQEEAARVKEEVERIAKEATDREEAVKRMADAVEERADAERRALEEQLWEAAGQHLEMAVTPPQVAKPSGRMTVGGPSTPGWRASGEAEEMEVVNMDEDKDKEQSHFAVMTHTEEHWDTLGALMMTLDTLSMDFHAFQQDSWSLGMSILRVMEAIANELQWLNNLKGEEMGKGKGKEKAKEEGPRRRMEDNNRDTEMGRAGPSSLV
ncbi:hypothetical protein ID866_10086 [Astraeus odoratus]|nr:hypothetical protein ID866_10086 [Astraeus odoratus]